jgi:glycosyltransferase involved in cell wall biosynthesis
MSAKNKVLVVGHYRESTGWGEAIRNYILAMDSVGIDLVCRPIKLGTKTPNLPSRIRELELKSAQDCNICLQYVLPHYLDYSNKFDKCIAMYATETFNFGRSGWPRRINQMDEAWVINDEMVHASRGSGINIPLEVVPHTFDLSKYNNDIEPLHIKEIAGDFLFYTVIDWNKRKNLPALVQAFHMEFGKNEPVSLLIKVSKFDYGGKKLADEVSGICNSIKEKLKKYPRITDYKSELIVPDHLSENELTQIHKRGNCYVCTSYGEAWCIPAFDAAAYGNPVIANNTGGLRHFVPPYLRVSGYRKPVFGMNDTFQDLNTCEETWVEIDSEELRRVMRATYISMNEKPMDAAIRSYMLEEVSKFSYDKIGKRIKGILENV